MKKTILAGILTICSLVFMCGCTDKDLPTPEKMSAISTVIGRTAGYACELSKTKTEVKTAIATVLDAVSKVTPATNETFTVAWKPVIDAELEKTGLKDADLAIAKIALTAACEGIDYLFVKYPKAREVQDLVSVSVDGFVSGYKSVVTMQAVKDKPEIDEDALKYIKGKISK